MHNIINSQNLETYAVGLVTGVFDLLHPGHLYLLKQAKRHSKVLKVALQSDPTFDRQFKQKPIQTLHERYYQLRSLDFIDEVIPYDTEKDLIDILTIYDFNARFLGTDYLSKENEITGKHICEMRGIKLVFIPRFHSWSSTELRDRMAERLKTNENKY